MTYFRDRLAFAYWDDVGESWPSRPSVASGVIVTWISTNDAAATPPSNAAEDDVWIRNPGAVAL